MPRGAQYRFRSCSANPVFWIDDGQLAPTFVPGRVELGKREITVFLKGASGCLPIVHERIRLRRSGSPSGCRSRSAAIPGDRPVLCLAIIPKAMLREDLPPQSAGTNSSLMSRAPSVRRELGEGPILDGGKLDWTAGCCAQMRYNASAFFEKSAVCSSRLKPEMISV